MLNVVGAGEYFGELALDEGPRSASVATLEPSKVAVIPNEVLKAFLASHPAAALPHPRPDRPHPPLHREPEEPRDARRLRAGGKPLLDLAREVDGRLVVEERLTQQDIGERVGASREMVSRILKDLTAGGYPGTTAARSTHAARRAAGSTTRRRASTIGGAGPFLRGEPSPRAPWRNEGRCRAA